MSLIHSLTREPYVTILFDRDKVCGGRVSKSCQNSVRDAPLPAYRTRKSEDGPKSMGNPLVESFELATSGVWSSNRNRPLIPEEGEFPATEAATPIASIPRTICARSLSKAFALVMRRGKDIRCAAASFRKYTIVKQGINKDREKKKPSHRNARQDIDAIADSESIAEQRVAWPTVEKAGVPRVARQVNRMPAESSAGLLDVPPLAIRKDRGDKGRSTVAGRVAEAVRQGQAKDRSQPGLTNHEVPIAAPASLSLTPCSKRSRWWSRSISGEQKSPAKQRQGQGVNQGTGECHTDLQTCRVRAGAGEQRRVINHCNPTITGKPRQSSRRRHLHGSRANSRKGAKMVRCIVEILTYIFQLAVKISYASGEVKDTWAALHVVCRRWYQIMLAQGDVASDIRITDEHWDVDFATHLLERSSPYTIHLTMVLENRARNAYTIQQLETFAEHVLTNHRVRIQSMVVGRSGFYADLRDLLLLDRFPRLRHLTIGSHLPRLASFNADELSPVMPALNSLSLASTAGLRQTAGKDHPIFLNLVTLELTGSSSKHDTTNIPWEFLKVIRRLPALQILLLSDYFPKSTRPSATQSVVLPASVHNIEYLSHKPTRSIMDVDALLSHDRARRTVELNRTDPLTVVDVVAGGLENIEERAVNLNDDNDGPAFRPDLQGSTDRRCGDNRRERLEISIAVDHEQDIVDLRLGSGVSSVVNIRIKNVGEYLAFAIARIPVHEIRKMFVYCDEPVGVLWQFFKESRTLVELQVVGRTVAEFVKVFEQDSKAFPALRDISLVDDGRFSPELLQRALARRHAEGVRRLNALAIPETAAKQSVLSFERYVDNVTYITRGEILRKGGRI
ncbi:hypothetical protein K488DRAFT_74958 [Vararia minispora EC-137]|uniref:Uncharacterized protein n=1 Tax=Vararia minispora EC-137 TaxID=1314806 RepID=A0ACB8Q648_9AGAM|nr:hypothetical protein K488DRAFT_74958 [Vararia minispora EC-137]